MQALATSLQQSETAFLWQREQHDWALRWFTPSCEVPLCGHATLASAHVLWQQGYVGRSTTARFHTRSGVLTATPRGDLIELDIDKRELNLKVSDEELAKRRAAWKRPPSS